MAAGLGGGSPSGGGLHGTTEMLIHGFAVRRNTRYVKGEPGLVPVKLVCARSSSPKPQEYKVFEAMDVPIN